MMASIKLGLKVLIDFTFINGDRNSVLRKRITNLQRKTIYQRIKVGNELRSNIPILFWDSVSRNAIKKTVITAAPRATPKIPPKNRSARLKPAFLKTRLRRLLNSVSAIKTPAKTTTEPITAESVGFFITELKESPNIRPY